VIVAAEPGIARCLERDRVVDERVALTIARSRLDGGRGVARARWWGWLRRRRVRAVRTVRPRLRDSLLRRFRARGPSLTFADLDFPEVKERVLTVAATPYSGRTVNMNATSSPNTAKRFFEITDCFPITPVWIPDSMHDAGQVTHSLA